MRMAPSTSFKYSLLLYQKFLPPSSTRRLVKQFTSLRLGSFRRNYFTIIKCSTYTVKMEKTVPRQFFDRIYGESSTSTVDQGFSNSSNSSIDLDDSTSNKLGQQVIPITPPYMNGFASFCKYGQDNIYLRMICSQQNYFSLNHTNPRVERWNGTWHWLQIFSWWV